MVGAADERGIPHTLMAGGAPNGYSILSFDGNQYTLDFRAASSSPDEQLRVTLPEQVSVSELEQTPIYVNVFNGSERSRVEYRIGDSQPWRSLEQVEEFDPTFVAVREAEAAVGTKAWRELTSPKISHHLYRGALPPDLVPGTHAVTVRTVDMHGRQFECFRVLRVAAPVAAAASAAR